VKSPNLIDVVILALRDGMHSTVAGPLEVFDMAGVAWNYMTGQPVRRRFRVRVVSMDGEPVTGLGGVGIVPHGGMRQVRRADLILVSSGGVSLRALADHHAEAVAWLRRWHGRGAVVAGMCSGVALLAEAGLLDGQPATTHWSMAERFRRRFPLVDLQPDRMVVDNGTVLSAGGVNAALDLSLHLVERYCGAQVARECARALLIDAERSVQTGFAAASFGRKHADKPILQAQEWIEQHYGEAVIIKELAARVHMSQSTFLRRFKAAAGVTPLAYLQEVRIAAARQALEQGDDSIERIGLRVGYEDAGFFRSVFRRQVGMTPSAYRAQFG